MSLDELKYFKKITFEKNVLILRKVKRLKIKVIMYNNVMLIFPVAKPQVV
jgi:hypothetical protein